MRKLVAAPLTKKNFEPFGDVIEKSNSQSFMINNGKCRRHHALALTDTSGDDGRVGINIFSGQPYELPHVFNMVERHPLGSQAFYPLGQRDWLVIVCITDPAGKPKEPTAFLATGDQGINLRSGVWHGVLTPLYEACDFLVVDRIGEANNLEEVYFDESYQVFLRDENQ